MNTLIGRATERCGERVAQLQVPNNWLREIVHRMEPDVVAGTEQQPSGAEVRENVESYLAEITDTVAKGGVADWLREPVEYLTTVLRRLGDGLYHCYDVPGLPRTNNDLEQFHRRVKAGERRITGHRRSDAFVVRVGEFAVYAVVASAFTEEELLAKLAGTPPAKWQEARRDLRANQERQAKMRRFRLHRDAYLADLEARWAKAAGPP